MNKVFGGGGAGAENTLGSIGLGKASQLISNKSLFSKRIE